MQRVQIIQGLEVSYGRVGDVVCVAEDLVREGSVGDF